MNEVKVFFESQTGVVLVGSETSGVWISADHESSTGFKGRSFTFLQTNYGALIKKHFKKSQLFGFYRFSSAESKS